MSKTWTRFSRARCSACAAGCTEAAGPAENAVSTVWKDRFLCFWFYTPNTGEGLIHGYPIEWDEAHLLVRIDPQWDYDRQQLILPELEESETFSTLIHELAHEMLHKAERRTMTTQAVRETEAEAVAFVVCHALGLETGTGSADYIQLYHGDANLLKESLEVVQRTSNVILGAISPEVTDRQKSDAEVR